MTDAIKEVAVERAGALATHATLDLLAVEEPLEIRISWDEAGEPRLTTVAVTMRTPDNDAELAAGFFDRDGRLAVLGKDVGRHNARDKDIARELWADRLPASERLLIVSGRVSFELIQKALMAGIPLLAAIGAPSSLAVELAREAGMTLLGFVRADHFNIYSGGERVRPRSRFLYG